MPHKVCGDKIIKIGVVFDFGLAHLYFTNIFTLKLLPYTKRFQTNSILVFSKYFNKKNQRIQRIKKTNEKKNHGCFVVKGPNKFSTRSCVAL
jgi:hypothetical protein